MTLFHDDDQRRAICDRILELAHFDMERGEPAPPTFSQPARVRCARTLYDLALALWDSDSHLPQSALVALDRDTRRMVGDLLADLGDPDPRTLDRWLENTRAVVRAEGGAS